LGLAHVTVSLTSLDPEIKRTLEPRAASPQARIRVIEQLSGAGIPVGVLVAPVIPVITDHELESLVETAVGAGARSVGYVMLRLPYDVKDLFREWLAEHYPQRAQHVMSIIQSIRGGRDNDPRFGTRMRGEGPFADLLRNRFKLALQRSGIATPARPRVGSGEWHTAEHARVFVADDRDGLAARIRLCHECTAASAKTREGRGRGTARLVRRRKRVGRIREPGGRCLVGLASRGAGSGSELDNSRLKRCRRQRWLDENCGGEPESRGSRSERRRCRARRQCFEWQCLERRWFERRSGQCTKYCRRSHGPDHDTRRERRWRFRQRQGRDRATCG
jgi:hypothetical protein